tara:strand:- start:5531 stop:5758 length:228 start_codon:yes stop_codon:yes gene_type:complete
MLYKDVKVGQRFSIMSVDDETVVSEGGVTEVEFMYHELINNSITGYITVQFDDEAETFIWGLPNEPLYDKITFLG